MKNNGASRIDLNELEKPCGLQCTDDGIAAFFEVSTRTIERRRKTEKFREVMDQGRAKGRVSIRRALFKLANAGNVAAAIFLAKNLLGYRDVLNAEHTGPAGGPIQVANKPDFSQLSNEDCASFARLLTRPRLLEEIDAE